MIPPMGGNLSLTPTRAGVKPFPMTSITSRDAAERLGVSVQTWHRLVTKYAITPERSLPGIRGAKYWRLSDVNRVGRDRKAEAA